MRQWEMEDRRRSKEAVRRERRRKWVPQFKCEACGASGAFAARERWVEAPLRLLGYKAYECGTCMVRFLSRRAVALEPAMVLREAREG